jgi:hypothetical protein
MHKGASQQLTKKRRGANRGRTDLKRAQAGRSSPFSSIHQRAAETKEKHREEADGRRKSSSCLRDGLGHALAAMVGPAGEAMVKFRSRDLNSSSRLYIQHSMVIKIYSCLYFDLLRVVLIHMCSYHLPLVG